MLLKCRNRNLVSSPQWDYVIISGEAWTLWWSVNVLGAFRDWTTCLSNYIQWSIKWMSACDKIILLWVWIYELKHQQCFSSTLFSVPAWTTRLIFYFFFKLPEVHSATCFTFKSLCHSQNIEVTITCCSAPASRGRCRQSSAVIQEEKTTRYMVYLRIYGSCHLKFTAYTRQNPKHGNGKQIVFLLLWNRHNLSAWEHTALQFYDVL